MKVRAAKGGSRKTILLFFFLFLHMEVTGEEERRRCECDMCRCRRVKEGERPERGKGLPTDRRTNRRRVAALAKRQFDCCLVLSVPSSLCRPFSLFSESDSCLNICVTLCAE